MIGPFRQRHGLPMVTPTAILRRVGRIDFESSSASFFRFAEQLVKKSRPGGICNALGKTMVVGHALHMQVFHGNDAVVIDDLAAFLVSEIIPPESDALMDTGNGFAMFATFWRPFGKLRMLALHFGKSLLFLAKKAWVGYFFTRGEGREGFQSNINSHLGRKFRQSLRFAFNRKRDIPLASARPMHRTRFEFPLDGTMIDHLDTSQFGEADALIMGDAKATLGKGEGVIAVHSSKPREARLLSGFAASEEGFEGQINAYRNVLEELGMDTFERRTFLFQDRKGLLLLIEREAFAILLIGCLPTFKQVVIEPTALFKCLVELLDLLLIRKETILKHFKHGRIITQSRTDLKKQRCHSTLAPNKERFSSPA